MSRHLQIIRNMRISIASLRNNKYMSTDLQLHPLKISMYKYRFSLKIHTAGKEYIIHHNLIRNATSEVLKCICQSTLA